MKLLKRHKGLVIVGLLSLILLVIIFAIFSRMLFSKNKTEYGDRLNGIVNIDKSTLETVQKKINEDDLVEKVSVRTQGKIIYTVITVSEKCSKDKAKEIATKSLENYEKEILDCYDLEYIITQNIPEKEKKDDDEKEEDKSFTIVGTKSPNNEKISWTRN